NPKTHPLENESGAPRFCFPFRVRATRPPCSKESKGCGTQNRVTVQPVCHRPNTLATADSLKDKAPLDSSVHPKQQDTAAGRSPVDPSPPTHIAKQVVQAVSGTRNNTFRQTRRRI